MKSDPLIIINLLQIMLMLMSPTVGLTAPSSNLVTTDTNLYQVGMDKALENLIEQYSAQKKYKDAIEKLQEEIKKDPTNTELLYKKASIYADIEEYYKSKAILKKILAIAPDNKKALKLNSTVRNKIKNLPHNEIGFYQDEAYVSDLMSFWTYSSLHYYRLTEMGSFGARINYANRYGTNAEQYMVEAYPKFSDYLSIDLSFGYANQTQILYPNLQYRIEPYLYFPKGYTLSLGQSWQKYITFSNQKIVGNTGTIGKYFKNNFVWYRATFYSPQRPLLNELSLRHYAKRENTYMTFKVNFGELPDIGDLPPFDEILLLKQKGVNIDGQYGLTKKFFIKGGAGYARQYYLAPMLLRRIIDGSLGFTYQF